MSKHEESFDELVASRVEDLTKAIALAEERLGSKQTITPKGIMDIHLSLRELYQTQLKLHDDINDLKLMVKALLGADQYAPKEELAHRAEILGAMTEQIRKKSDGDLGT
jgi:hypothetical protein